MSRYLPVFPLGGPLLPVQVLPLHIFEDRYRVLMEVLTAPGSTAEMGVVMIERGSEVGGGDERSALGTVAHLIESERLPDGRWVAIFAGSHPFRVERWLDDDPFPRAMVEEMADTPWQEEERPALDRASVAVRKALTLAGRLGEPVGPPDFAASPDPVFAAWELCNRAPLGPLDRQKLLQATDRHRRLDRLTELSDDAARILAFRLDGR